MAILASQSDCASIDQDSLVEGLPYRHRFDPVEGILSVRQPLEIVLEDYPIWIEFRLDNGAESIVVAPRFRLRNRRDDDEFTKRRFDHYGRLVAKRLANLRIGLVKLEAEKSRIELWLKAPIAKDAHLASAANSRLLVLNDQLIPAQRARIQAMEHEVRVISELVSLGDSIHLKTRIVCTVRN